MTNIYLEESPNPNSLKFVVNYMIVPEGETHDFPDEASASYSPLAKELFNFEYVKRVFIMNNFVTITKDEEVEWYTIKESLKHFIHNYLESEKPVLVERDRQQDENEVTDDSEVGLKVKTLLEEYVKPAVEQDGGAIEFHSFNDGVVKVLLKGACSGCPSSMYTLKAGIENLLRSMIPEVKAVEAEGI
jgi:Fe-S cluster biogenesis protein NfuA